MNTFKLLTLAVLAGIIVVSQAAWFNVGQPEDTTSLAMEQFENPSLVTDTVLRNVQAVNSLFVGAWGMLGLLGLAFYAKTIKETFIRVRNYADETRD